MDEWQELSPPRVSAKIKRSDRVKVSSTTFAPPNRVSITMRGTFCDWARKTQYVAIAFDRSAPHRLKLRPSSVGFRVAIIGKFKNSARVRLTIPTWGRLDRDAVWVEANIVGGDLLLAAPVGWFQPLTAVKPSLSAFPKGAMGGGRR